MRTHGFAILLGHLRAEVSAWGGYRAVCLVLVLSDRLCTH